MEIEVNDVRLRETAEGRGVLPDKDEEPSGHMKEPSGQSKSPRAAPRPAPETAGSPPKAARPPVIPAVRAPGATFALAWRDAAKPLQVPRIWAGRCVRPGRVEYVAVRGTVGDWVAITSARGAAVVVSTVATCCGGGAAVFLCVAP